MSIADSPNGTAPAAVESNQTPHPSTPPTPGIKRLLLNRRLWLLVGLLVLIVLGYCFIPSIILAFTTVSTDDAYVNGHVTFVAPRVAGQVAKVRVDDNYRVKKGDLLAQLDKEPFQVQLNIAHAAVAAAEADLRAAQADARATEGQMRSLRFNLDHAIEDVNNQIALLRAKVAALNSQKAVQVRAQADFGRVEKLMPSGAATKEELDLRRQLLDVAKAQVEEALQGVYQQRVFLGLPIKPAAGDDLGHVPPDLDQSFSTVRQAQASLIQSVARIGLSVSFDKSPREMIADFYKRDPQRNIDRILAQLLKDAPTIKQADTKLAQARRNLDQAALNLRYCDIISEIDGVVTRRNINPGNNVTVGQSLMAVRSLTEVWIDANFKETQLADLRIGQRAKVEVDTYGSRKEFEGRITGFTMGTGQTLALLPPQNATGNFVKIVQRLPVRIELTGYDPDKVPLFVGLSVTPYVYVKEPPTGPNAGQVLQPSAAFPQGAPRPNLNPRGGAGIMSSVALAPALVHRRAISPWIVALAVVIPTFMEVLDTTIANVALRYIAGGLSAAVIDSEWVLTSYLAANATILPISGWISARLGRRNYFLLSIAVFTLASGLCGMATSLGQIIAFRVLQGLAGGGLQPSSQGVLLDAFPPEKQGAAQTMFGIAALLAPVVGPTLGGYLTVQYDWRWIFYINVPVGALALVMCYFVVEDPEYLKTERANLRRRPLNFDYVGLGLLALVMSCWEIAISKGQEWDWLGDPFGRVQTLAVLFVAGLVGLIYRELRIGNPVVNFRVLRERNLAASCVIIFCAFGVLYGASTSLPGLLQSLFGYDAYVSGLVQSPAGIFSILTLLVVGTLIGWGLDVRWLVAVGLLVMAAGCYWMALMNLYISPWQVVWPRVVMICGLSMIFAPLNVAAFKYIPTHLRGAAVGLFALLRNEGGSVGTSMAQTIQERRLQFHAARVNEFLDPLNPQVNSFLEQARAFFYQQTGDATGSQQQAVQALQNLRQQQADSLAYFDVFWLAAVLGLALVVLVLLMKRSVAEKGAHAGGE